MGERQELGDIRARLETMARELHALQETLLESQAQRALKSCATRISWAAARLTTDGEVPQSRQAAVQPAIRAAVAEVKGLHGTSVVMLALLMSAPGQAWSSHRLAVALGVAQKSVRVFAFHVRGWLQTAGLPEALQTHAGIGYSLRQAEADTLRQRHPALDLLADLMRDGQGGEAEPARDGDAGARERPLLS